VSAVSVEGVAKAYDGRPILERVSLEVPHGQFVTLVGPSGCGKSTFLRLLLSQEFPDRGGILVDGAALPDRPTPDRGIVFQRYSVFPHLTVAENLILGAEFARSRLLGKLFGKARRRARADIADTLAAIGLVHAADLLPAQLSGGMQQRLAIAQALLMKPRILLLDEPFGALDPGTRQEMQVILLDLWRSIGMTVFMVTHDIGEAFLLGTRLLVFDKVRHDPQYPEAYGATVTYDIPLTRKGPRPAVPLAGGGNAIPNDQEGANHV
jgi:NitT/TauT family transport system ATP-binding protein